MLLCGACGKMGRAVTALAESDPEIEIICGVDKSDALAPYPVYHDFGSVTVIPDVIVDFSNVSTLDSLLDFAVTKKIPLVIATTGYTENQIGQIKKAAETVPVFFTFNMSLGINLLCSLAKKAADILGEQFDIEIVEKHHNQKLDAPSGTALMLANAINEEFDDQKYYEYDRHSKRRKRSQNEIGIHSIRGGTIVGEHEVIFAGHDEVITLSHSAGSKEVFAVGALKAAKFLPNRPAGLYDMKDVVKID